MHIERQGWITLSGTAPTLTAFVQDEEEWHDAAPATEVVLAVEVASVTNPAGVNPGVTLSFVSSATKDVWTQGTFATLPNVAASSTFYILRPFLGSASLQPHARWLRFQLSATGTGLTGNWGATFRYHLARARKRGFSPMLVPGLVNYFRADMGLTLAGSSVNSWTDQISGLSLTPPAGIPTFAPQAINGMPAIQFSSANNQWLSVTAATQTAQGDSMIVVFQSQTAAPGANAVVIDGSAAAKFQTFAQAMASKISLKLSAANANIATVAVTDLTQPTIIQVDWNGASTKVYQNNGAATTVAPGGNPFQLGAIGNASAGGLGGFFNGLVAEVLLYSRILGTNERTLVSRYLGQRYGISVP